MSQSWIKAHTNIDWENKPSTKTPLDEANLNKMDHSIDDIDNRVITLDSVKTDEIEALQLLQNVTYDDKTGIFTFHRKNGTTFEVDTLLDKIIINFDYDDDPTSEHYQQLIITTEDGEVKYVDLSALITQYEFDESSDIRWVITQKGHVTAYVVNGSITEEKLQPNYLADIKVQVASAERAEAESLRVEHYVHESRDAAKLSEDNAKASEIEAKNSENAALISEVHAKDSEINALASEMNASVSEQNSWTSEQNAKASEEAAKLSEINAKDSEGSAKLSEDNAKISENNSKISEDNAKESEDAARELVKMAIDKLTGMEIKLENGHLYYKAENNIELKLDQETGHLQFTIII